ncbi:sodium/proline symporter PutP [Anaerostipes butyraticus]|uniref:sodium/proline symporter PutP n=1 Tax=Anaerostipes butyraticus TaxID=645466 RepID=UPI00320939CA
MSIPILIAMVLYMAMVIGIGFICSKKNQNSEDYFLGGRGLGPWVTAMSAEASDMSSWLLMGLPGLAFATGFSQAGWTAIGLILGTYLNWKIIAKRLRHYTEVSENSITVPDFFSNRFKDDKKILSSISAIMILIFFTVYTASGFAACGTLFNSVFGLNYQASMIVCAAVIVFYTSLGGFLAASTTDLIQGLLMSFAIVVVLIVGIVAAGGVGSVIEYGRGLEGFFDIMKYHDPASGHAVSQGILPIVSGLAWGLGYFGMSHILVRFMAIRDPEEVKKSRNIAMTWVLISLAVAVCIGFTGAALYSDVPELAGNGNQRIFIYMTTHLFQGIIPLFIAGIILSGILAATMSTSDSQLLIASSCVSKDLFQGLLKKEVSEKHVLMISRVTTILIALIGIVIAMDENSSVFGLVENAWAGFGGAFGPLMLFSLFWKRTNLKGAAAGMLSGGIIALVWPFTLAKLGGIFEIYCLLPAFIVSSLLIVVVSLCTEEPDDVVKQEFDQAKQLSMEE